MNSAVCATIHKRRLLQFYCVVEIAARVQCPVFPAQ